MKYRTPDVVGAAELVRPRGATTRVVNGASVGAMASIHAPEQLEILPGARHGTDMPCSGQPTARPLLELVLRFLRCVPPGGEERG